MGNPDQINFRIDSEAKARIQEAVNEEGSNNSYLFRVLGSLYLGEPAEADKDDISAKCFQDLEERVGVLEEKLRDTRDLSPQEWHQVRDLLRQAQGLTHPFMMDPPLSVNRVRGFVIVGRLQTMWYEYETRVPPTR